MDGAGPPRPSATANDRLKARWRSRLQGSMMTALALHVVLFAAWPNWERLHPFRERLPPMVQIHPIVSLGGSSDAGLQLAQTAPEVEDAELSAPQGNDSAQESNSIGEGLDELLYTMRDPIPRTVNPVIGGMGGGTGLGGGTLDDLRLDAISALTPRVSLLPPTVDWPMIRNPGVVDRALRAYSRTRDSGLGASLVSIALAISDRGTVEWAEVQESSGQHGVDQFAVSIFNEVVVFAPARRSGSPVPVHIIVSILF
jgi:hypothetical protein